MALCPIAFARKGLSSLEKWYSNIEREVLGILHMLKKFHSNFFSKDVHVITDHKPLETMTGKDAAMLSHRLWGIMLQIHLYSEHMLYKPCPESYIADWLSHCNNIEN